MSPPGLAITSLPGTPGFVFYKYFSLPHSPLFGFAAVKQEDQADGSRVLIFDSLRKSRFRKDWELRHDSSVFEPREQERAAH